MSDTDADHVARGADGHLDDAADDNDEEYYVEYEYGIEYSDADAPAVEPVNPRKLPPYLRPKPPRDWRWVVGGVGKTLIATGLLIFAFVAYQLWGTGIQYAQAQDRLENQFDELLATAATAPAASTSVPTTSLAAPATTVVAPTTSAPVSTTVDPAIQLLVLGGALGKIEIPEIDMSGVIVAGVRTEDLKKGIGHYPDTPLPGQAGNAAIAGHRTTYGAPFYRIDELEVGDEIKVTTLQGAFVYRVTGQSIVAPSDYSVVADQPGKVMLTLTSCHPRYSARQRIIVTAELDVAASDPVETPVINYGHEAPLPAGSDDGLDEDPSTVAGDESPIVTDAAAVDDVPPADAEEDAEELAALDSADAFSDGWFSDEAAFSQVALWGFALTAVALLFTFIGRRTRNWIGALTGIGPFVVVLYFWFENVNRLLPPGF
ncbi:MAG: class E sortase [Acidimicrobiia bacterium]